MLMLFPRRYHAKHNVTPQDIERAYAHRLLDMARRGLAVDLERITWALKVTGDME